MKQNFKNRFRRLILLLLLGFLVLFLFRLMYGYTKTVDDNPSQAQFFQNISNLTKNYASKKYEVKSASTAVSPVKVDQKYETSQK